MILRPTSFVIYFLTLFLRDLEAYRPPNHESQHISVNLAILTPSLGPLNHVTFEYFGVFEMKHQIDRDLEAIVFLSLSNVLQKII